MDPQTSLPFPADDFALVNQGQLKAMVTAAYDEMESHQAGSAGPGLTAQVKAWFQLDAGGNFLLDPTTGKRLPKTNAQDFSVLNLGQLKAAAKPLYDRLMEAGAASAYPWTYSAAQPEDYALVNQGQLKNLFNLPTLDLFTDSDADGLPDWWESKNGATGAANTPGGSPLDSDGDGLPDWYELLIGTDPDGDVIPGNMYANGWDTDGDGIPDAWEAFNGLNPTDAADGQQQNSSGKTNLQTFNEGAGADLPVGGRWKIILYARFVGNETLLTWDGKFFPGQTLQIQRQENYDSVNWNIVATVSAEDREYRFSGPFGNFRIPGYNETSNHVKLRSRWSEISGYREGFKAFQSGTHYKAVSQSRSTSNAGNGSTLNISIDPMKSWHVFGQASTSSFDYTTSSETFTKPVRSISGYDNRSSEWHRSVFGLSVSLNHNEQDGSFTYNAAGSNHFYRAEYGAGGGVSYKLAKKVEGAGSQVAETTYNALDGSVSATTYSSAVFGSIPSPADIQIPGNPSSDTTCEYSDPSSGLNVATTLSQPYTDSEFVHNLLQQMLPVPTDETTIGGPEYRDRGPAFLTISSGNSIDDGFISARIPYGTQSYLRSGEYWFESNDSIPLPRYYKEEYTPAFFTPADGPSYGSSENLGVHILKLGAKAKTVPKKMTQDLEVAQDATYTVNAYLLPVEFEITHSEKVRDINGSETEDVVNPGKDILLRDEIAEVRIKVPPVKGTDWTMLLDVESPKKFTDNLGSRVNVKMYDLGKVEQNGTITSLATQPDGTTKAGPYPIILPASTGGEARFRIVINKDGKFRLRLRSIDNSIDVPSQEFTVHKRIRKYGKDSATATYDFNIHDQHFINAAEYWGGFYQHPVDDVERLKAMGMTESELGRRPHNRQLRPDDIMTIANPEDETLDTLHFVPGHRESEYDASNNRLRPLNYPTAAPTPPGTAIVWGVCWLYHKAQQTNNNSEFTGWRTWDTATGRYNWGTDTFKTEGDKDYKIKVERVMIQGRHFSDPTYLWPVLTNGRARRCKLLIS